MEYHINVRDLNVKIGGTQIINNVSLDIPRGQVTAILGPSGCGKTTLMRTMNRFLELTENSAITGQILLDGKNIYDPDVDVTEIRTKNRTAGTAAILPADVHLRECSIWAAYPSNQQQQKFKTHHSTLPGDGWIVG